MSEAADLFSEWGGRLDYPMFIVTTTDGRARAGCLVGFATQSSIDPPRFTVFISDKNFTFRVATHAHALAVHLVPKEREDLARLFGEETGDEVNKFSRCEWTEGPLGVPVLPSCSTRFVGEIVGRVEPPDADHVGFVLAPVEISVGEGPFLPFSVAQRFEPGHEA